jgi:peptidoglycan/LPS O-acetylase OafA/YrhL
MEPLCDVSIGRDHPHSLTSDIPVVYRSYLFMTGHLSERSGVVETREIWLDGLRGLAACIVAFSHLLADHVHLPYRSYWEEPAADNRSLFQLPPFRLIFAGRAMVTLFFVISGYSISLKPIILRNRGSPNFHTSLESSIFRRAIRLYIPVYVLSAVTQLIWYLGLYEQGSVTMQARCPDAKPWSSKLSHLACLVAFNLDSINTVEIRYNKGLNPHLWSIRHELRNSYLVYLVCMGLAQVKRCFRLTIIFALTLYCLWYGISDVVAFFSGLIMAEYWHDSSSLQIVELPSSYSKVVPRQCQIGELARLMLLPIMSLVIGLWLLCLPYAGDILPPDYNFQLWLDLPHWSDFPRRTSCWHTLGSVLVLIALHYLPMLQHYLASRSMRHLGRISYSLYLFHLVLFDTMRMRVLNFSSWVVSGQQFLLLTEQSSTVWPLVTCWSMTTIILGFILVFASGVITDHVDRRGMMCARMVEQLIRERVHIPR